MISSKLMGLAALALLAGGMGFTAVGCSSDDNNAGDDDEPVVDGGGSSGRRDGGGSSSGDSGTDDEGFCEGETFTKDNAFLISGENGAVAYAPATTGACTAAELTAITTAMSATDGDPEAAITAASANCKTCLAGPDDKLGPLPLVQFADGNSPLPLYGACFASVTGKADCGYVVDQLQYCQFSSCLVSCEEGDDINACVTEAGDGFCADFVPELGTCAAADLQETAPASVKCNKLVDMLNTMCGSGAPVGDAGTTDAGN